jgi:hypothetical protein
MRAEHVGLFGVRNSDPSENDGGGVAGGEARLLFAELGGLGVVHFRVKRAARPAEDVLDAGRGARGDAGGRSVVSRYRHSSRAKQQASSPGISVSTKPSLRSWPTAIA